jgi:predicted lipoprotein
MRWVSVLATVMAGAPLCSCRFIPTADVPALAAGPSEAKAFDPDKMVASEWSAKVVPYFEKRAGPFAEVRDLAAKSPEEAGARFGYRPKSGDVPWTYLVKLEGVVVEANTESRAATIGVDTTGKGKADNLYVDHEILGKLSRESLVGRKVTVLGAYSFSSAGETPLITPVEITLGPKP